MILSHKTQSIFIHIQKTAGASIEAALRAKDPGAGGINADGRRHVFARDARTLAPPAVWNAYFKFAFVRNPWERLVSWYQMCIDTPTPNRFAVYVRNNAPTFTDFILHVTTGMGHRTTLNQLEYITDEEGKILIDFVGRYENLARDFAVISEQLGLEKALPRVNASAHDPYQRYYSAETRDLVAQRFARDIAYFDYSF